MPVYSFAGQKKHFWILPPFAPAIMIASRLIIFGFKKIPPFNLFVNFMISSSALIITGRYPCFLYSLGVTPCSLQLQVGVSSREDIDPAYSVLELPASQYASFDVYVKNGYESENNAMDEWLKTNQQNYTERLLNGTAHYCVEFYDERFQGEEDNSIVEIWIPVDKVRA